MKLENIDFLSEGEIIRGCLLFPSQLSISSPAVIKCHGFPGSSNQISGIATELANNGFIVLTFDFRGFRNSDGHFSYSGEILDVGHAISFLEHQEFIDPGRIGLYGASFGGAVAICRTAIDSRVRCVGVRAPVYNTELFLKSLIHKSVMHCQFLLE